MIVKKKAVTVGSDIQKHLIHIVDAYCVLYMLCVEKCALLLQFVQLITLSPSARKKKCKQTVKPLTY